MMTNREWLERLPDEELAEFFLNSNTMCNWCVHREKACFSTHNCKDGVCKWLQQEHNTRSEDN